LQYPVVFDTKNNDFSTNFGSSRGVCDLGSESTLFGIVSAIREDARLLIEAKNLNLNDFKSDQVEKPEKFLEEGK
jgi:hypothetical protein